MTISVFSAFAHTQGATKGSKINCMRTWVKVGLIHIQEQEGAINSCNTPSLFYRVYGGRKKKPSQYQLTPRSFRHTCGEGSHPGLPLRFTPGPGPHFT